MSKLVELFDIAIIGVGLHFPGATTLDMFWDTLAGGKSCITVVPSQRWDSTKYFGDPRKEKNKSNCIWGGFIEDIDAFDASFFNISRREAELMDPQQRIALELAWQAMEDAGYRSDLLRGTSVGVFMGVTNNDYTEAIEKKLDAVDMYLNTGTSNAILSNRISHWFDLKGPSITIDGACAGSLIAVHQATLSLKNHDCEMAFAGGVNLCWSPRRFIGLSQSGSLSKTGLCKTFDADADGYVRGEGGGVLLLKPLAKAISDNDRIYGIIRGSGTNHGGKTNSLTVTNPKAHADLIQNIYRKAGVDPETVTYIEAHGVGTPLGDSMEIKGLKNAFSDLYQGREPHRGYCGLGSVKSNFGHTEAAAGIAGILKILACMQHDTLPATLNFNRLNPLIDLKESPFYIVTESTPWRQSGQEMPRRAGVSSFGFGGGNAHVLLEEYLPENRPSEPEAYQSPFLVPLSARSVDRLREYAQRCLLS